MPVSWERLVAVVAYNVTKQVYGEEITLFTRNNPYKIAVNDPRSKFSKSD